MCLRLRGPRRTCVREFLVRLPFAASLPDGRRMSAYDIGCASCGDRVGAQDQHRLVREVTIQSVFVVEEIGPVLLFQPRRACGDSQALIASTESVGELCLPTARHLLEIRAVTGDVPRLAPEDLDATINPVSVEGRNGVAQHGPRVLL